MGGQNIVNMIRCRRGTHPLFRTFGMGAEIDSPNRITKGGIQVEVNKWFPATSIESLDYTANEKGEFDITIKVQGA